MRGGRPEGRPDHEEGSGRRRFEVSEDRVHPTGAVELLGLGDAADDGPAVIEAGLGENLEAVGSLADDLAAGGETRRGDALDLGPVVVGDGVKLDPV